MVEKPCLLLVVTSGWHKEVCRKLAPLDQMMDYISFGGPGRHRILATIVWQRGKGVRDLKEGFVRKRYGTYRYDDILDWHGDFRQDFGCFGRKEEGKWLGKVTEFNVEVAPEFFAKEPLEWLSSWVNLWHKGQPVDQCQFRRRFLLAFPKSLLVLLWIIFVCSLRFLLVALFLLCGLRRINFKPLLHPFGCDTRELTRAMKKGCLSVFFSTKKGDWRPFFFWPFAPIFILGLANFSYLILGVFFGVNVWQVLKIVGLTILGLSVYGLFFGVLVVDFGGYLLGKIKTPEWESEWKWERERKRAEKREQKELEEKERALLTLEKNLLPLVCTGVPLKADLNDLPPSKRTVYLRFLDLKKRACKPFARY